MMGQAITILRSVGNAGILSVSRSALPKRPGEANLLLILLSIVMKQLELFGLIAERRAALGVRNV